MPKMTGARLFAQMMQGYGVTHVFFVPAFMLKLRFELALTQPAHHER
jgi:hypothetical protein